jgi:hypothetical protein
VKTLTRSLAFLVSIMAAPVSAYAGQAPSSSTAGQSGAPVAATTPAADQDPVASFFKQTELSGFVDVYFGCNFNTPGTRLSQLRSYDTQHDSFTLSLAELSLEKKPTVESRGGYRLDLDYGSTATIVHASEPGGTTTFQNVGQAYLSFLAPAGQGLQFDIGEFYTPIGNEVVKAKDNWNYSRSLLFTLAEPTYHSGVRVSYSLSDRVALGAYLVNGWNDVVDNNTGKTVGAQITLKPSAALTIVETYLGGPEQAADNGDWRHLADTVLTYTATPKVSLAMNYDFGQDRVAGTRVRWQGVAGYFRYQPIAWFALSPRAEWYDDPQGFTSGSAQSVKEITLTAELKHKGGTTMRIEYRRDVSNQTFFLNGGDGQVRNQDTLTFGFIYAFSSKAQ